MIYNINEINIGDEVIFRSTDSQSNHDEYWNVTGFNGNKIYIELNKLGFNESWTIDIKDVVGHNKVL